MIFLGAGYSLTLSLLVSIQLDAYHNREWDFTNK